MTQAAGRKDRPISVAQGDLGRLPTWVPPLPRCLAPGGCAASSDKGFCRPVCQGSHRPAGPCGPQKGPSGTRAALWPVQGRGGVARPWKVQAAESEKLSAYLRPRPRGSGSGRGWGSCSSGFWRVKLRGLRSESQPGPSCRPPRGPGKNPTSFLLQTWQAETQTLCWGLVSLTVPRELMTL